MKVKQLIAYSPVANGGQRLVGLTEEGLVVMFDENTKSWERTEAKNPVEGIPLERLNLETRIINALRHGGWFFIEDIEQEINFYAEKNIIRVKGLGYNSFLKIKKALEEYRNI